MIVATPRPGSPTSRDHVPSNSTSLEALERLPSLSLRRCRRKTLRVPSGRIRGTAKQPMPSSSGPGRGTGRTSAPSRTTCARAAGTRRPARRRPPGSRSWCWRARRSRPASPSWPCRTWRCPSRGRGAARRRSPAAVSSGSHSAAISGWARSGGHGGEGHRHRAAVAGLDLARGQAHRRAGGVRAGAIRGPRQAVQPLLGGQRHQPVPRGVELDLVDAVAEAVVGAQLRRMLVGQASPLQRLAAPGGADRLGLLARPSRRPRARAPRPAPTWSVKRLRPSRGGGWLTTSWVASTSPGRTPIVAMT